jgi:sigma-54 dependent transcriptional regulator, acetoin dehydrogenase operon transcriptional activator AcoR
VVTAITPKSESLQLWKNFINTGSVANVPEHIARSWLRCRDAELKTNDISPTKLNSLDLQEGYNRSLDINRLLITHNKNFREEYPNVPIAMFITNPEGHILSVQGHDIVIKAIEQSPLDVGVNTNETSIGTTAPSISIAERTTALVIGEEHYFKGFHWASCFSIPIYSSENKFSGVLDFSSSFRFGEQLKQMIPFLLHIANSIQFEVFVKNKLEELMLHETYFESIFAYAESMLLITDINGRILRFNSTAQKALQLDTFSSQSVNINEIISFSSSLKNLSEKTVNVNPINADDNASFAMEIIPIYNRSGLEKAFVLKIKKKASIASSSNTSSLKKNNHFNHLLGHSKSFQEIINRAKNVANTPSSVLLEGATGTGKELLALGIHHASQYSKGPFVAVNCSAIPTELVESEFFGYEKGAFTGAQKQGCTGKFEQANKGTLFLDEVHTMGVATQMKLLRVLEEHRVTRVGGTTSIKLDLRIITATSANLLEEVSQGRFLDALYYRLNVVKLLIPSLKDRKEDIPYLVAGFIDHMNKRLDRLVKGLTPSVEKLFQDYDWPGNIRELKNCIESACVFCVESWIKEEHLKGTSVFENKKYPDKIDTNLTIDEMTDKLVKSAYERFGNANDAAQHLGMSQSTFYRRIKKINIAS